MKFSYNWIRELSGTKLPVQKLAELLTMHSFEVNELKKMGSDWLIDIDVLPNRAPDCFSHFGIARECSTLTNSKFQIPLIAKQLQGAKRAVCNPRLKENKNLKAKDFVTVEVKNKQACPRYSAKVVINIKVGPSPKFIQERLKVCGLRPINNIVDIANYVMLETGQPLHAFDGEKLADKKIVVRFAKRGEKITTLDNEKYDLGEDILVIADAKKPIAIAGIKGGKEPEIDKKTKIVVIESANFNSRVIRKGSQKLNLKTDASWRFEHGIDPNLTEIAVNRTASLIKEIACPVGSRRDSHGAGGEIAQGLVDFYPKKILPKKINLDLNYVERLLGVKISKNEMIKILKNLGFKVFQISSFKICVEVPTRRLDISLPEDLIEEIGRIYGYQKIPATLPLITLIPPKRNLNLFWENIIKDILKEAGFTEVYNYSFFGENLAKSFGHKKEELIEVENPVSVKQKYLRPSLIPNLLKNVKENLKYFDNIKIFELGKIYFREQKTKNKEQVVERRMLSGLLARKEIKATSEGFYELKGVIDSLLNKLGISNIWYDEHKPTPEESKISIWQLKKAAEIKINHIEIGFLGEISSKVLGDLKIGIPIFLFELDFELLSKLASEEHEYRPISRFPAAVRDLAVLVPRGVLVEEVLNKINVVGGSLVRDVDLFDIYEGEELPQGKKNLAFHIIYQAQDRTLKSAEIDEIHQKITKALEKESEWQVRR